MESMRGRLQHLYEISKLLTAFESIERTIPQVLAFISEIAPLRIAVLLLEERTGPRPRTRSIVWHAEGESATQVRGAQTNAKTAYGYLIRPGPSFEEEAGAKRFPTLIPPRSKSGHEGFVLLPLVLDHGRIFGALHLEGAFRFDETDLAFLSVVVNQLAIAVDRIAVVAANQAAAKGTQVAAELLADTSARLYSSLEYEKTLDAVVQVAVPLLGDISVLDMLTDDGRIQRVAVHMADASKHPNADRIRQFAPAPESRTPQAQVLRSGEPIIVESFESFADNPRHVDTLKEFGVCSIMVVPLIARGRTLGSLSLVSAESGRRYHVGDLALAKEIGLRASIAIDNARLYARAQRATDARQALIAIVSHDLKSPLASVLLSTDLLLKPAALQEPVAAKRLVDVIARSARRMNRLLSDLLDITSIEAGHLSVNKDRHECAPIIREAIEQHAAAAERKALRLESCLPGEAFEVYCDRDRVLQVLGNLIGNAIKFSVGGTIKVGAQAHGRETLFSVADAGPGIASDEKLLVFDWYWQASKTAALGTGLGLSISKGLVELHAGRLWVEDTPGGGATFFFALPVGVETSA